MELTNIDKAILKSYEVLLDSLGEYLGSAYELSLHSLEDFDHSVIKIINGYHSGRTVGSPLTDLAVNMLKRISDQGLNARNSYTVYNAINPLGERLKSSTIPIIGENDRLIGLLCINFYLDTPLSEILSSLSISESERTHHENFAKGTDEGILNSINEARNAVLRDQNISAQNRNKEIIRTLYEKGIFNIKDSVITVAKALDISKNTVYLHLRSFSK